MIMSGACFYTEHAKPRNVCFQRHFAKAGLYIVPTHVTLYWYQIIEAQKTMDCDARSGATKYPEIRSGAEGILTCGYAADWWHRTLLILFGLIGIR